MNLKISVTTADIAAIKAMSKDERNNLKIAINSTRPRSIFTPADNSGGESIICPFCGNGSGENHTPVKPNLAADGQTWLYNCFRGDCSFKGDLIELIAVENNLDKKNNFAEILAVGAKLINYTVNYSTNTQKSHGENFQSARKIEEIKPTEYERLAEARENLTTLFKDRENFRGLPADVLERLKWGYLTDFNHPKKSFDKYSAVIIPNVKGGIFARAVGNVKKMDNISPTAPTIINLFDGNDFVLTVVEGAINGASLAYATEWKYSIIATGGTTGGKNLIEFLKEKYPAQKPKILVMFDNDENDAGKDAAEKLLPALKNLGFISAIRFIDERKNYDFNNILVQEGKTALAERFNKIVADAQNDFSTAEKEIAQRIEKSAQDNSLEEALQEVNKKLKDFDAEKDTAIEKLKAPIMDFSKNFVFSDEIVTAAAFAKIFDKKVFSDFKAGIQNQIDKKKTEKFILEWIGAVKDKVADLQSRRSDLTAQRNNLQAQINSQKFIDTNSELSGFKFPVGYSITDNGIEKVVGEKLITVARRPVVLKSKMQNVEDKTFKYVLSYKSENEGWRDLSPTSAGIIANARKIIDLADYGLPVTSGNANLLVDYLDAFKADNEKIFPMSKIVSRGGWHEFNGQDYFVDPRRECLITTDNKKIKVEIDSSSTFAQSLKSVGSLAEWKKAYEIAKPSPVARLVVAASVAAPLLKFLGERNFLLYIVAPTRAGKTTALYLGASAVGDEKIIRSFDATKNGLAGAAADVNDYVFMIDEKQVADNRLKEQFDTLVYALANGIGRTKLNRDSTLKKSQDWRTTAIMTGETVLFDDNVTGGANTRCLSIAAPNEILSSDDCREIRQIIKDNFGHVLTRFIKTLFAYGFDKLRERYQTLFSTFTKKFSNVLPEYCRYMAIMTLADAVLNIALGLEEKKAFSDAVDNALKIFPLIPTLEEISDTKREKDFVLGFIAQNQRCFIGATLIQVENMLSVYGKFDADYIYLSVAALQTACKNSGFDYRKVVEDLITDGFFVPADKVKKGRNKPNKTVDFKLNKTTTTCYRIPASLVTE